MTFHFIYNVLIQFAWLTLQIIAPLNNSLAKFVKGRKYGPDPAKINEKRTGKRFWMHCASLGEYEQGKVVLEKIRESHPDSYIIVSFFSPSGFEIVKKNEVLDEILYLPVDIYSKAKRFIERLQPDLVLFVKYDFWFNYLRILNEKQIPIIYISVLLKKNNFLLGKMGRPWLQQLREIDQIFVQDQSTKSLLENKQLKNVMLSGDTRVDAVYSYAKEIKKDLLIEEFTSDGKPIIMMGSAWEKDMELVSELPDYMFEKYKWIIAPHLIGPEMIRFVQEKFSNRTLIRYTDGKIVPDADLLILDTIGLLKSIYHYATFVYVGGGFGKGIHNTLEPAAFAKPVIFGPEYRKFREAVAMVDEGAFFSISDSKSLELAIIKLEDERFYKATTLKIGEYIHQNKDASKLILKHLERFWKV